MSKSLDKWHSVRQAIGATFPECPANVIERFVESLEKPIDHIIPAAKIVLNKPYGRNHILFIDKDYGLSLAQLETGRSTSLHVHMHRRELFCVRHGSLRFTSGDKEHDLDVGQFACSTPGIPHSVANGGEGLLEIVEIFSPPLLDDKCRMSDPYNRPLGQVSLYE